MFGIDVSHHNGVVDWLAVTSNVPKVDFAILKASEGATSRDKKFAVNAQGCVKNKIPWGAYHFATWNSQDVVADAKQEAANFIGAVKVVGVRPDLPLVLDVESNTPLKLSRKQVYLYCQTFLQEVIAAGYDVAIYSSPGFLESNLPAGHNLTKFKLWIAHYTTKPAPRLAGWKNYWIWQYTDAGTCKGVKTACDLNRTLGPV